MNVALVVIDDGRPKYLHETINSLNENLVNDDIVVKILVNDSGDADYTKWLNDEYTTFVHVDHDERRGLSGAIKSAWDKALSYDIDFIWHHEGDFVTNQLVDVDAMVETLLNHRHLAQLSLKRQPVNSDEERVGGFIEMNPSAYSQRNGYVEHQVVFTFNPCLIPRFVAETVLQRADNYLERGVTSALLDAGYSFGIYGNINDAPRITHIGETRANGWSV